MTDQNKSLATTHADGCWSWGHAHYDCAVWKIRELRARVQRDEALLRHALGVLEQIATDLPWELTGLQADTIAALLRQQADLAAELHGRTRSLGRTLDALIEVQPALASALLPAQVLLREVEGRLCDVSDHIHTVARRARSSRVAPAAT